MQRFVNLRKRLIMITMACPHISERNRNVPMLGATFGILGRVWAYVARGRSFDESIHIAELIDDWRAMIRQI